MRPASSYGRQRVRWLPGWEGLIPLAMLSILVGYQGDGKTLICCLIAAGESRAGRRVVIATTEDEIESVLRPRLEAAGADLDLVSFVVLRTASGEDGDLQLPDHGGLLVEAIERENPSLFILDPMEAFLGADIDSWKSPDIRRALRPISTAAERAGCAAIVVGYLNRSNATTKFLERIAESMAFSRASRSALLLWPDPDDPEGDKGSRRILALGKTNLAPRSTPARIYRIEAVTLPRVAANPAEGLDEDLDQMDTARIVFVGDSELSANELLASAKKSSRALDHEPSPLQQEAIDLLRREDVLWPGEPVPSKAVYAAGAAHGLSTDVIRAAAKALGVKTTKNGFDGGWTMVLPDESRASRDHSLLHSSPALGNHAGSREDGRRKPKGEPDTPRRTPRGSSISRRSSPRETRRDDRGEEGERRLRGRAATPRVALTVAEAAEAVGISESSFRRYLLPELRVVAVAPRLTLVRVTELDRFLETAPGRGPGVQGVGGA